VLFVVEVRHVLNAHDVEPTAGFAGRYIHWVTSASDARQRCLREEETICSNDVATAGNIAGQMRPQ